MCERKYDLDIMRIACTLGVICIHAASGTMEQICVFAVPLFVMISGALWLDGAKTVSISKIWKKNIFRLITAFAFWSFVYAVYGLSGETTVKKFIYECITGHYHMWFCYMIVGVYMFIPIIRKLKEDKSLYLYFLILSGMIMVIIPSLLKIPAISALQYNIDLLFCKIGIGYIFYFMLGDFLYHHEMKAILRIILYIAGLISFIVMNTGLWPGGDFDIFTAVYTSCIMVLIKDLSRPLGTIEGRSCIILQNVSRLCFGIYLTHALVLKMVGKVIIAENAFMDSVVILVVFTISLMVVYLIDKIPLIRKYIL